MSQYSHTISIKKALIRTVMLVAVLSLALSISVSTYLDINKQQDIAVEKLATYAKIISFNAQISLVFDDSETEENRLLAFKSVQDIENIHIYKVDNVTNQITFFASYNAPRTPPVPTKISTLTTAKSSVYDGKHIDIIQPIRFEGITEGYVYIRGGVSSLNIYIKEKLMFSFLLALSILLVVFSLSLKLQRQLASPIETLSNIVQDVSKNKNYDIRAPHAAISELDLLSHSLNVLFSRTQAQLERQHHDELEIRQLNQNLEEKVNHRTVALKEANQELLNTLERMHQYQNQIVENEKMASLGQMVAGVAHEVNTPLGLGITGSTLLKDKLAEIKIVFDNKTLTSAKLEKFIDDGIENLDLIYRSLNRAAELISSFKQVAVNQDNEVDQTINVFDLINKVALTLKGKLSKTPHKLEIICPEPLEITSKSEPIQQILQHLINNSLIHGLTQSKKGKICICVKLVESSCIISYTDNGQGMPSNIRKRIFDPFVTTKRGEGGSGLGMHLVYNLVTQALDGSITLKDDPEVGVHFEIILPIKPRQTS